MDNNSLTTIWKELRKLVSFFRFKELIYGTFDLDLSRVCPLGDVPALEGIL